MLPRCCCRDCRAIFGYAGQSNTLKLVDEGEDGLEEMAGEFNSGQVQYGIAQVKDPNSGNCKLVLINWVGRQAVWRVPTCSSMCMRMLRAVLPTQGFVAGSVACPGCRPPLRAPTPVGLAARWAPAGTGVRQEV